MRRRKGGDNMDQDIRKKINELLDKITDSEMLNKIYHFIKFVYIFRK